jgi:hypothetical protein
MVVGVRGQLVRLRAVVVSLFVHAPVRLHNTVVLIVLVIRLKNAIRKPVSYRSMVVGPNGPFVVSVVVVVFRPVHVPVHHQLMAEPIVKVNHLDRVIQQNVP